MARGRVAAGVIVVGLVAAAVVEVAAGASSSPGGYYDDDGRLVYSTPTREDVGPVCVRVVGPDHLWRCVDVDIPEEP